MGMSENRFASKFLGIALLVFTVAALVPIAGDAQSAKQPGSSSSAGQLQTASAKQVTVIGNPTAQKALLDQYCVVCHNDKAKTANFSLQTVDINAVGDHPEMWEQVIRKLRAGMMPPPGMPRPPLAKYEGLRDWLEAEIDRKAAAHPESRLGRAASAEPHRIRQRHPRSAGSRDRRQPRSSRRTIRREASTTSRVR